MPPTTPLARRRSERSSAEAGTKASPSAQIQTKAPPLRGKKNRKDQRRLDDATLIAIAERAPRQAQQGLPDHFNKLMDGPCPNHAYPVKHLYEECELLKCFLR